MKIESFTTKIWPSGKVGRTYSNLTLVLSTKIIAFILFDKHIQQIDSENDIGNAHNL